MQFSITAVTDNHPGTGKANHRLRPAHRLPDKTSFTRVFQKADRSRDNVFTVLYRPNDTDEPRLGLAIAKKNCKLASGRNRLKRVIRESFRQHRAGLGGIDIVVLSQAGAAKCSNAVLFASLEKHWRRCCASQDDAGKTS